VPSWNDLGNVWTTLRELDVNAIRVEAEKPLFIACIGDDNLVEDVSRLLHRSTDRYPGVGIDPIGRFSAIIDAETLNRIERADLALVVLDARKPIEAAIERTLDQLESRGVPILLVLLYGISLTNSSGRFSSIPSVAIAAVESLEAPDTLARMLLERLPDELHLTAARRLPGLRTIVARDLVNSVSFSNATYALAAGLPQQIPILSVPCAAADILVLTKNQALLVYKLALAYGAPPDFQSRIKEVLPVVGGAYVWRQVARSLVGLVPVWGVVPKVAVSYAGTYSTGIAAWRWYASGELVSGEQLKQITQEAMTIGRERARELLAKVRGAEKQEQKPGFFKRIGQKVRGLLPGKKQEPPALPEPQDGQGH
jgi:uncharacterized protein (DUF697 family)